MSYENFSKGLKIVLDEMCSRVNADPSTIDFKNFEWYTKYSWSQEDQDDFLQWLENQLLTNKDVYRDILASGKKPSKHEAKRAASMFVLNYGWTTRLGTENKYRTSNIKR